MPPSPVAARAPGVGRLGTAAAWVSAVCCLPYLVLKVAWTLDVPLGIADPAVLHGSGWVAANAIMGALQLAGLLLVLALTRAWARRAPAPLVLFPAWVGTGLLFQAVVGAVLVSLLSPATSGSGGGVDYGGFRPWVFVVVYTSFAGQGIALAIAFGCYIRARWGRLLGDRTGTVLARRAVRMRSWPDRHLAELAEVVAAMAVAVAVVCAYWAAGGSYGLPQGQPDPSPGFQAARIAGALTAAVGLLAIAGNWGRGRRFWLPAALVWLGSGAMAAFDGLSLVLSQLLLSGADAPGWSLSDTVVVLKVVVGLAVGAVGVVAMARAAGVGGERRATR